MKKTTSLLVITMFVFTTIVTAQTKIYRTKHLNVGFGKDSNCADNKYLDFCVNGPLVGLDQLPIGGYIDNGNHQQVWVDPRRAGGNFSVDNAVFGFGKDGKFYMIPSSDVFNIPPMQWAFQNGPMLVKDGENARGTSTSMYARSGIGYTSDGTLVVIISLNQITFREFAEMFIQEHCINAIYLDGGPYVGYSDDKGSYGTLVPEATKLQFFNN